MPITIGEIYIAGIVTVCGALRRSALPYGALATGIYVQSHLCETIEGNPLRQSLIAQVATGSRRAADSEHERHQTHGYHHEGNEDFH